MVLCSHMSHQGAAPYPRWAQGAQGGGQPGGLQGRGLELSPDVQEVVAEEDTALQQQEQETDAVPEDASLLYRQQAVLVPAQHLLGCGTGASMGQGMIRAGAWVGVRG